MLKATSAKIINHYLYIYMNKKPSNLNLETLRDWGILDGASQEVSHLILVHSSQKLQPRAFWSSLYGIQCFTLSTSMRFISQTSNNSCKIIHLQLTWKINKCQWHSSNVFFKHAIPQLIKPMFADTMDHSLIQMFM